MKQSIMTITVEEWKELMKKLNCYCDFEEVSGMTYEDAEIYMKNVCTFVPM